jgi:hydroxymethylpyrimidine pyrophosphatase-like HAD family hydrolase
MINDFKTISDVAAAPALSKITTIYSDLDATMLAPGGNLLRNTEGKTSLALASALVALKLAGLTVIAVTGRNKIQGMEMIRILNLDAFIAEMGTAIMTFDGPATTSRYDTGDYVWDAEKYATPYESIKDSGIIEELLTRYAGKLEINSPWHKNRDVTVSFRGHIHVADVDEFLASKGLGLVFIDNGIVNPFSHNLQDVDEFHGYHLVPKNTSKALSVKRDMEARGIARENALSIGDGYADVEVGWHTGVFVAMKRALELQKSVDLMHEVTAKVFVTERYAADGFVDFADAILAAKGLDRSIALTTLNISENNAESGKDFLSLY